MAATTLVVIGNVRATQLTSLKRELREYQGIQVERVVRVLSAWLCSRNDYDSHTNTEQFMFDRPKLAAKFGVSEYELIEDDDMAPNLVRGLIASSTDLNLVSDVAGVVYSAEEHPNADADLERIFRCNIHKIHPV